MVGLSREVSSAGSKVVSALQNLKQQADTSLFTEILKYDPNILIIGDRYIFSKKINELVFFRKGNILYEAKRLTDEIKKTYMISRKEIIIFRKKEYYIADEYDFDNAIQLKIEKLNKKLSEELNEEIKRQLKQEIKYFKDLNKRLTTEYMTLNVFEKLIRGRVSYGKGNYN